MKIDDLFLLFDDRMNTERIETADEILMRAETMYEETMDAADEVNWVTRKDAAQLFARAYLMSPELTLTEVAEGFDCIASKMKPPSSLAAILANPETAAEGIYTLMIQRQRNIEQIHREYEAFLVKEQEEFKQRIPFQQAAAYCRSKTLCSEYVHLALFWSLLGWAHCKQKVLMTEVPIRTRDYPQFKELDMSMIPEIINADIINSDVRQFLDAAIAFVCSFDTVEEACNYPNREPLVIITEYGTPLLPIWFQVYSNRDVTGSIHKIFHEQMS